MKLFKLRVVNFKNTANVNNLFLVPIIVVNIKIVNAVCLEWR